MLRTMTVGMLREALNGVPEEVEVRVREGNAAELYPVFRTRCSRMVDLPEGMAEIEGILEDGDHHGAPVLIICLTQ